MPFIMLSKSIICFEFLCLHACVDSVHIFLTDADAFLNDQLSLLLVGLGY